MGKLGTTPLTNHKSNLSNHKLTGLMEVILTERYCVLTRWGVWGGGSAATGNTSLPLRDFLPRR